MPDSTTPTPTPAPEPKKAAKRGFIEQYLEDALDLAENCAREAGKEEIAPKLLEREWTAPELARLVASHARCEQLVEQIQSARTGKLTRTDEEDAARTALIHAFDPVLKGARRTFPEGSAERTAYGIGTSLASHSATICSCSRVTPPASSPPAPVALRRWRN